MGDSLYSAYTAYTQKWTFLETRRPTVHSQFHILFYFLLSRVELQPAFPSVILVDYIQSVIQKLHVNERECCNSLQSIFGTVSHRNHPKHYSINKDKTGWSL